MNAAKCAVHREVDAIGACPRCGNFVCRLCTGERAELTCGRCASLQGAVDQVPTAWEQRDELGLFAGLWQTWKSVMFSPDLFYRSLRPHAGIKDAMLFALAINLIVLVPNFFLQASNYDQLITSMRIFMRATPPWLENLSRWEYAGYITLAPLVIYPLSFYLGAGMIHLGCLLWGCSKNGFEGTARVMGYAQAAAVVVVVPVVGGLLALYLMVLMGIGITRMHETTGLRAAAAALTLPVLLGVCGGCGAVAFIVYAMGRAA